MREKFFNNGKIINFLNKEMLSYRFRIYPSKTVEQKLGEHLELCRWLYNRLLYELNKAGEEDRRITQKDT